MTSELDDLDDLDQLDVHDLWPEILRRSAEPPSVQLDSMESIGRAPWPLRTALGLTAAACLLGILVVTQRPASLEPQNRVPVSTPDQGGGIAALPRLAALALPSSVPDGWHLAELATAPMTPNSETTQPSGQLYRRPADGAGIRLTILPAGDDTTDNAPVTTTLRSADVPRADVVFDAGVASFQEAGADVRVQIAGVSSQEATAFVGQLTPTGSGSDLRFQSTDPAWTLEASVDYVPSTPDRNPYGVVTYRSDSGATASFRLVNDLGDNEMWRLGVPTDINGVTVYRLAGGATRQVGSLLIAGSFAADAPTDAELRLLASFSAVDESTWSVAADQLAARYLALPTVGRLQIDDVTVTQHSDGDEVALCGTVEQLTRCVPDQSRWSASSPLSIFEGDLNLDGTWVHVGASTLPALLSIAADTDAGAAIVDWTTTDVPGVLIAAVAPSTATAMSINAKEDSNSYWGSDTARPLN